MVKSRKKPGKGGAIQYCLTELIPENNPIDGDTGTSTEDTVGQFKSDG